ncbi:uncharacterized protein LOC115445745 [Manduca sexta]|uniref:Uncharacterized protein n=1 Tax=Manduca sexta TaxID=7130 RepID=A0A922CDJ3_MANSE|nr:uncharacterized protein LOC115445745 [Manduca sexta]KAG6441438.1 hypothetical protein O3G_MSEX001833 [Manduca sexta]
MKFLLAFCVVVGVTNAALLRPPYTDTYTIALHEQRQFDIFESTKNLIQNLLERLRKAASEARETIGSFTTGVQNEANVIKQKIIKDIKILRERVATAIDNVSDRLIDSGTGVVGCVATSREEAALLFNETLTKALGCVDDRIKDVSAQIHGLTTIANNATEFANKVVVDMRHCTAENGNILSIGGCLGNVAIHTEMKVAVFATQTTLTIGRISLTLATLPASLEVCAGTRLVEAGISTTKIIMEIGTCSANSVYTSFSGGNTDTTGLLTSNADLLAPINGLLPVLPSDEPTIERQ